MLTGSALAFVVYASLASPVTTLPNGNAARIAAGLERPEHAEGEQGDECEAIEARRQYYYRRHSDAGIIDPARMRELVRQEYEKERTRLSRIAVDSIGGTNWLSLGPTNLAGRVNSIATHPTTAGTVWIGSASGGVWKTTDSGANWTPLTEGLASLTVGAVAVAPSNANRVYLGTGEPVGSASGVPGIGLLRSDNGGGIWTFPSPGFTTIPTSIAKLNVYPTNADDVLAGTSSGGFRSANGGANWTPWTVPPGTPANVREIVRDPANADTVYAAVFNGSSASKVLKSTNGGTDWADFSTGLPTTNMSVIAMGISSAGTTLYASFAQLGVAYVYKSISGGAWAVTAGAVSPSNLFMSQPSYDNAIVVAPSDANTVILCGVLCSKTTNGGANWASLTAAGGSYHVDFHDMKYDAGGRLYMGTDGGITTSTDHGENTTSRSAGLVTAQYYDIAMDDTNPDRILGGMQDNGTNRRTAAVTTWDTYSFSDGFVAIFNKANPTVAWSSNQPISRGTFMWRSKSVAAAGVPISWQISPPFPASEFLPFPRYIADHENPSILYLGTSRLWKTTTGGDAWFPLPTTTTDGSTWNTSFLDPIAASSGSVIMVGKGTDIFRSTDGGTTWRRTITGLPVAPAKFVNGLEIDPLDANVVYVALASTAGNAVFKTINGGLNWALSSTGLPNFAAQVIRVDPTDSTTLFCGTDVGIYRSTDSGATWSAFGTGLPKVIIYDIEIADDGSLLRLGTHGRGVWELQIPPTGNTPPTTLITSPGSSTVALGTSVTFSGSVNDGGEKVWASWHFPDTWDLRTRSAPTTITDAVSHVFTRAGIWPVTLRGWDRFGAASVATVTITVTDIGDACSSPIVIPNGALPATKFVDTETFPDTTDLTDPIPTCGFRRPGTAWFQFTAPSTATYDFSTCGSMIDTVLSAYTGTCGTLTSVACNTNIDDTGTVCPNGGSTVSYAMTAGQTILLMANSQFFFPDRRGMIVLTASLHSSTAPTVTRIAGPAGPSTGGKAITIYGSNFLAGATVSLGGTAATDVTIQTPNIITARTGSRAAATVDVAVTSAAQSGRLIAGYTYLTCSLSLSPTSLSTGPSFYPGNFDVTASAGCGWMAFSNAAWITTVSSGIGNGSVIFAVAANTSVGARSGTITVGDQTFTISQSGVTVSNLVATASLTTSVSLTWVSTTVDHFEVWRNSGGGFSQIASPTSPSYTDTPALANTAYVYKVRAVDSTAASSPYSNLDLATTILFTDDPLVAMTTVIQAVHLTQLRTAVNAVRTTAGIGVSSFTDDPPAGVVVKAVHFTELQSALDAARSALMLPAAVYAPVSAGNVVTTAGVTQLRNAIK